MDKQEFLRRLGNCLNVLEDGEQTDILEEYSQHIDMKRSKGLSEEDAIRDFGRVEDLAAEILEAYHVKPDYRRIRPDKGLPGMEQVRSREPIRSMKEIHSEEDWSVADEKEDKGGYHLAAFLRAVGRGIKTGVARVKAMFIRFLHILGTPFRALYKLWNAEDKADEEDTMGEEYADESEVHGREMTESNEGARRRQIGRGRHYYRDNDRRSVRPEGTALGRGIRSFGRFLGDFVVLLWMQFLWCVRLVYNASIVCISLFGGITALLLLFAFAVLLICWFRGYPLLGVTLACLGGVISSAALTMLFLTFLRTGHKAEGSVEDKAQESTETPSETGAEEVYHA